MLGATGAIAARTGVEPGGLDGEAPPPDFPPRRRFARRRRFLRPAAPEPVVAPAVREHPVDALPDDEDHH
jgi:hypothetical protein